MRALYAPLIALPALLLTGPAGQAAPMAPAALVAGVAEDGPVLVFHKPGHQMKSRGRGRHLGWTRGKHKGWSKHRR